MPRGNGDEVVSEGSCLDSSSIRPAPCRNARLDSTQVSKQRKEAEAARYDRGITQTVHHINDLVMVYQKGVGELQPRWRGPFRIVGDGGSHESSSHPPRAGTPLFLSPGHPYQVALFEMLRLKSAFARFQSKSCVQALYILIK